MPTIWMVSAEFGKYTDHFVNGGYAAVGWLPLTDLRSVSSRDEIKQLYISAHPDQTPFQVGANVGQIERFVLKAKPGDYVMTRCAPPTREYRYGVLEDTPLHYAPEHPDGCPFPHRREVTWSEQPLTKAVFSIPAQKALGAAMTVFEVRHLDEFRGILKGLEGPGEASDAETTKAGGNLKGTEMQYKTVLDQVLKLKPAEFEYLIRALMEAMGYEGVERTGRTGDGGVDVRGTWQSSLAAIDVYVQAKHYGDKRVGEPDVRSIRGAIPTGGQEVGLGATVTTSDFDNKARTAAADPSFPPVTLIDGKQLVNLLMEHWNADSLAVSPDEDVPSWHERLGLTQGLVPS